jgi:V/A-type H+/Na+-transporting ATPase subunit E
MEIQLQEMLDRIKRDGVEAAKAEAARIIATAEARAKELLAEAERQARTALDRAAADARRMEEAGKAALSQASRDLLLGFRDQLRSLLDALIRADTAAGYGPEVLAEAIPAVVKALAQGGTEDLAVLLPPAMLAKLDARMISRLAAELTKGVELRPAPTLDAGFRVSAKDGSAYVDFSADAVAELLSLHLNARLSQILKDAARGS